MSPEVVKTQSRIETNIK